MSKENYDVIVVGGGIVGASAGYHLARRGVKALLIDRRDVGRASDAGAGILAPDMNRRDPEAWFRLAVPAVEYYPTLIEELAETGATETGYARCGMLLVAATDDEIVPFEIAQEEILTRRDRRGTPSPDVLHPVSSGEARELFPPLGNVYRALYYRDAARVDGRLMGAALLHGAQSHGLAVQEASVDRLVMNGARVTGVTVGDEEISAGAVIIAGGAWSAVFGVQLSVQIPVEPQRGQIAHLWMPDQPTGDWPIVSAFHGHYLVAWPGGRVAAGASRETGSGFAPITSVAGIQEVLSEAVRVAPGLEMAQLLEVRVGLRPLPPDGLPVLGGVPGVEGVVLATGHGPTGLQLGPLSGEIATVLALGGTPQVPIDDFSITRFGQLGL